MRGLSPRLRICNSSRICPDHQDICWPCKPLFWKSRAGELVWGCFRRHHREGLYLSPWILPRNSLRLLVGCLCSFWGVRILVRSQLGPFEIEACKGSQWLKCGRFGCFEGLFSECRRFRCQLVLRRTSSFYSYPFSRCFLACPHLAFLMSLWQAVFHDWV